ncbi:hypothetical protein J9303_00445 [Bacillaceae bacterium Marseille-Q3522]|nr:hypothetical protein [Bacillaceae bacterium Marseille-Q3522]
MKFSTIPDLDYGKKIEVTFMDGHTLTGKLIGYTAPGDSEKKLEELTIETIDHLYVGFDESEVKLIKLV